MPRWVDLSAYGLTLKVRKQDDLHWLMLEAQPGGEPIPEDSAIKLGFSLRDGAYQREGSKISLAEVQSVFPNAGVREFDVEELRAQPLAESPAQAAARAPLEVVNPPSVGVPAGGWLKVLGALSVRGSIPINKVPWLKIDDEKWTDGNEIVDTATLAAQAERRADVLEGEATRVQSPASPQAPSQVASDEAIAAAAALSLAEFKRQASASHDGASWQVHLGDHLLFVPPELGVQSARKRPETILVEAHEAQVMSIVRRNPYELTSLPSLAEYPALAYPGVMSRGRKAEINVMRLLAKLGIADRLLQGEEGHCVLKNQPYMDLVIERHGWQKPDQLYLTHYFDQNGDRIMDAEMVFKIEHGRLWFKETASISMRGGELRGPDRSFANLFSQNLLNQGFGTAAVEWPEDRAPRAEEEIPQSTPAPH